MRFSIFKRKTLRQGWRLGIMISFGFFPEVFAQSCKTQPISADTTVTQIHYISAFYNTPTTGEKGNSAFPISPFHGYTIQICTLGHPLEDKFFQGEYIIRYVQMGDLYRYIFAAYYTLEQARQKLKTVQLLFPQACIREYRQGLLGQIVNSSVDSKNIKN